MRWANWIFVALAFVAGACGSAVSARAASRTIVYIGADDCRPCHQWEATYQKGFAARCAARGVRFRAVRVATLRNIRDTRYWPADLRPLLRQFSDRSGTPHFLAVRNGEVIVNVHGISRYQHDIASLLR
jgi:hypothetical protein